VPVPPETPVAIDTSHLCLASDEAKRMPLVLSKVTARYGAVTALRDLTARAEPGTFIALVGPNGAGKSTILKSIVGTVEVVSGRIAIGDAESRSARRRMVAYVSQHETIEWDFPITATEVVELGQLGHQPWVPWRARGVRERASRALEAVGVTDLRRRSIGALSGGQQQRVILARALVQDAPIFLLDEPLSGVDPTSAQTILALLRRLVDEGHMVLMATHDVQQAALVADRVWGISGTVVADVPAPELLNPAVMKRIYGDHLVVLEGGAVALGDQQH
jgi:ABC-type Mn2+/Zn2+ transport system ATPase subunit